MDDGDATQAEQEQGQAAVLPNAHGAPPPTPERGESQSLIGGTPLSEREIVASTTWDNPSDADLQPSQFCDVSDDEREQRESAAAAAKSSAKAAAPGRAGRAGRPACAGSARAAPAAPAAPAAADEAAAAAAAAAADADDGAAMMTTPPASADSERASPASSSGLFDRAWKRVEDLALNVTKKDVRRELRRAQCEGEDEETVLQQALALLVEQHSKAASRKSSVRTRREQLPKCSESAAAKVASCATCGAARHTRATCRAAAAARAAATTTRTWRTSASIARSGSSSRVRRRASMGGPGGPSCRATQALLTRRAQQWTVTAMR